MTPKLNRHWRDSCKYIGQIHVLWDIAIKDKDTFIGPQEFVVRKE